MIPYREEMTKRHLRVTGDLGKIIFTVSFDGARRGIGLWGSDIENRSSI